MDPSCHTDWRSAAGTLNHQRGRGLAGNQAPHGRRVGSRQRPPSHPGPLASAYAGEQVAAHGKRRHPLLGDGCGHGRWRSCRAARKGSLGLWSIWAVGPRSTDCVAGALKRPNRTMAGSWIGLHNHPVGPARSRVTASIVAVPLPPSWPDEHPVHSGPDPATGSAARKGMRRGSPTQRQGRT
jgi:hypothetical protein